MTPHAANLVFYRPCTQGLGKHSVSLIGEDQTSRVQCNFLQGIGVAAPQLMRGRGVQVKGNVTLSLSPSLSSTFLEIVFLLAEWQ